MTKTITIRDEVYKKLLTVKSRDVSETYHVTLKMGEDGWYVVQCLEIPAAISQGRTKEEALTNIREAIVLVLEELRFKAVGVETVEVTV